MSFFSAKYPAQLATFFSFFFLAACSSQSSENQSVNTTVIVADSNLVTPSDTHQIATPTEAEIDSPVSILADSTTHQIACLLAGIPIAEGSTLAPYKTVAWSKYATQADSNWAKYHRRQTKKMIPWAETELSQTRSQTKTIFYPFSGPDFLNVNTFFPDADTIIMIGLEPIGRLPQLQSMTPDSANRLYPRIEKSLYSVLSFSFFQTISMAKDLKTQELNGTLPLIALFMVRQGQIVENSRYVQLNSTGEIEDITDNAETGVRGTEVRYRKAEGSKEQVLYYFSINLVDFKLKQNKAFLAYLERCGTVTTYLKSASYLLHKSYFSTVANFITSHSQFVLQDDSGMPLRYFGEDVWSRTFFGTYDKPIDMFAKHYQPDLYKAYHQPDSLQEQKPKKLPFGIGYDWRVNSSNLMLFEKK